MNSTEINIHADATTDFFGIKGRFFTRLMWIVGLFIGGIGIGALVIVRFSVIAFTVYVAICIFLAIKMGVSCFMGNKRYGLYGFQRKKLYEHFEAKKKVIYLNSKNLNKLVKK